MALIEFQNNTAPYLNAENLNNNFKYCVPVGGIIDFAGSLAPDGYLICDGSAISRTTYSNLFNIIGTTYGIGDGTTTFNLPDLRSNVTVGLNQNETEFNTLGKIGGSKYLQQHRHNGLSWNGIQGESISLNNGSSTGYSLTYQSGLVSGQEQSIQTYPAGTGNSGNLQPYIVLNKIIKY